MQFGIVTSERKRFSSIAFALVVLLFISVLSGNAALYQNTYNSGFANVAIANHKGRNPVIWGVLGFLFGLLAVIVCAVMPRRSPAY